MPRPTCLAQERRQIGQTRHRCRTDPRDRRARPSWRNLGCGATEIEPGVNNRGTRCCGHARRRILLRRRHRDRCLRPQGRPPSTSCPRPANQTQKRQISTSTASMPITVACRNSWDACRASPRKGCPIVSAGAERAGTGRHTGCSDPRGYRIRTLSTNNAMTAYFIVHRQRRKGSTPGIAPWQAIRCRRASWCPGIRRPSGSTCDSASSGR